ncbi:putative polyketide synthase [Xylariomycetidae sp. FL2044]|nr:putative polyketide synthase [Xylariomycetidae sp. FL2044]
MAPSINEPIAIIGSACRFAGDATSPSKLWELLRQPKDVRRLITDERFNAHGFYHHNNSHHGHSNVRHAYMIEEDVATFDAEFFGIKPVEARAIDPQQRLLMEVVYEGLEDAGLPLGNLRGSDTSVYVGVMCNDYEALLLRDLQSTPTYLATGIGRSILSNRLSYFFDWHGPSITMDTACSSSLVSVHMAVQTLRSGDSRVAVACGSNLLLGPENFIVESKLKMLSPDGRSKMWDRDANGYARGDGVAAVVLKTLSQAIADGDNIDCIIRETGLNQDGATTGITMPSSVAQKALILSTYEKAGLNIENEADRPQYFEAHGTGTPAGDPIEAEAIAKAFYGDNMRSRPQATNPLYVGSIKTVLGHTEGTAGLAAILKASLALKSSVIPPNLLFHNLSEGVRPFYENLEIPTSAIPWPATETGIRRASVNSFGFGGANAHAILESYEGQGTPNSDALSSSIPFVFSAASEKALRSTVSATLTYLQTTKHVHLASLAYTLHHRRSLFPYRTSFTASSVEALLGGMAALLEKTSPIGVPNDARMGAALLEKSPVARRIVQDLESYLAPLPDRPKWSLQAELLASADTSRVAEAAISQPLCTAVQIMILDILTAAGIELDSVIGHSSGEIAAAYASGFLSARDAMVVAYYRGVHAQLAASPSGAKGAMLAVGTSLEDAQLLCQDEEFEGRIGVAASNSSSSVTISGDEDAIDALQIILQDENKFNRKLRVDKAYHSVHMLPAFDPYVESVKAAGVEALRPTDGHKCKWLSSVYNQLVEFDSGFHLGDKYWAENMTKPVLFTEALTSILSLGTNFDLVLEIGPHPALQGPASQTIEEVTGQQVPYTGTLSRGNGAMEALAETVGFLWERFDKRFIDLQRYHDVVTGGEERSYGVIKGVPGYQWNHSTRHWHESRRSHKLRTRKNSPHSLLGDVSPDSAQHSLEWRNLLRPSELPWLDGHRVQSQIVFPAAGYASTAFEAAKYLAEGSPIRLIELNNLNIRQAVAFSDEEAGVEVLIRLTKIEAGETNRVKAEFTYSADLGSGDLTLAATGDLSVLLGEPKTTTLPGRSALPPHTIAVETERFYRSLADLGYNFSGRFQSLSGLRRKHGLSTCVIQHPAHEAREHTLLVHPAELDASFQSIILAYAYPYDDQLRMMHLPTNIAHIRVNPALCGHRSTDEEAPVDAWLRPTADGQGFTGDCTVYASSVCSPGAAAVRVEGVTLRPLGSLSAANDRKVFSEMCWYHSTPDVRAASIDTAVTEEDKQILRMLERMSTYYLRQFDKQVPADSIARRERPNSCYLNYAKHMTDLAGRGDNPWIEEKWQADTLEDVYRATDPYRDQIPDVRIMHLVGQQMPRVFRGETTMLEEFRKSGLLDDYYTKGFGFKQVCKWLSSVLIQICNRYPHMNILEIGAGTGGATKSILPALDGNFMSYTFTDISAGFFENAATIFSDYGEHMRYKVLDLEKDPLDQGFIEGTYDVVVGSLVVHATAELEKTMRYLRKLLKPGGYLVIGEGSHNCTTGGFIFGPLAGWWLGVDEGRTLTPFISGEEWHQLLRKTGFCGIDTAIPKEQEDVYGVTVWVAQATNKEIDFIRQPLSSPANAHQIEKLAIVGGKTTKTARLIESLTPLLSPFAREVRIFDTVLDVDFDFADATSTVLSLADLDGNVFEDIQPDVWHNLKQVFGFGKSCLWLTSGRLDDSPYGSMTVGFGRTAQLETPGLRLQFLDVMGSGNELDARQIAAVLLRLQVDAPEDRTDILWTVESEMLMDNSGQLLVPRLRTLQSPNDRYNSAFRPIQHEVDITSSAVQLQREETGYSLKELSRYGNTYPSSGTQLELYITHSLLYAVATPFGHKFLVLGAAKNGRRYMALVSSPSSITTVSVESSVPYELDGSPEVAILSYCAAYLAATAICYPLFPGEALLAHNAPPLLSQAIRFCAEKKGVGVAFASDSTGDDNGLHVPPYLSTAEAAQLIPQGIRAFVGLSDNSLHSAGNEATLFDALPSHVLKHTSGTLYSSDSSPANALSAKEQAALVQQMLNYAESQLTLEPMTSEPVVLTLEALVASGPVSDPSTVVDWTASHKQLVRVSRLDSRPMFKPDKTYWMVGLSGALGISLCDWMIESGARHLVLTSRNPKIAPEWIDLHKRNGVNVTVIPCDVTDEPRLRSVHRTICDTLPPIVGVLNGAMVLRDVSILNMSHEQLTTVTRPKVLGSVYLDRIFDHQALDFFIFFSSINCIVGNLGQANYAAANMFMCAMAANRRKRGLTACALNVGAIIGAGYMERESSKALDLTVSKMALMHLSEEDFHQLFAEGVEAGLPGSPHGPELSTGLLDIAADAEDRPRWCKDPKFLHFITNSTGSGGDQANQKASVSISDMLKECKTEDELVKIVKATFAAQLRNVLQMTTSDEDLMAMRSSEIGLDSLISVDVRSWFLKNFHVSIPVLKIMGNDTMESLAKHATENISPELVPLLDSRDNQYSPSGDIAPPGSGDGDRATHAQPTDEPSSGDENSPVDSKALTVDGQSSATSVTEQSRPPSPPSEAGYKIDYEEESKPPADFAEIVAKTRGLVKAKSPPEAVLLTGVSGLLGRHLVNYLLDETSVKKIICVAVRELPSRLASGQLRRDPRVSYFGGDLTSPRLGLLERDAAAIFDEVDVVVHNGADTSHLKYYDDIKRANVDSTRWLARMCLPRRVPVHYVSSVGVALFAPDLSADFHETSATAGGTVRPPADGSHGYIAAKWTSERFLERVATETYGLKACIHRPSTIIREGADTLGRAAQMDWVNALIEYAHRLRMVPKWQNARGALDFVYSRTAVESIGSRVVAADRRHQQQQHSHKYDHEGMIDYVHQVGDLVLPLDDMSVALAAEASNNDAGHDGAEKKNRKPLPPYRVVVLAEWSAAAVAAGLHPAVAALIEDVDAPGTRFPRMRKG